MITSSPLSLDFYEKVMDAGVQDCFIKPFSTHNILVNIRKGLRMRSLILQKKELEDKLHRIETFLLNQKPKLCDTFHFLNALKQEVDRASRYKTCFSMLLIENNCLIYNYNPEQINAIEHSFISTVRQTDIITRLNGTYGFLLPETQKEGSQQLSNRLNGEIRALSIQKNDQLYRELIKGMKFISITYPEESEKITEWLKRAKENFCNQEDLVL